MELNMKISDQTPGKGAPESSGVPLGELGDEIVPKGIVRFLVKTVQFTFNPGHLLVSKAIACQDISFNPGKFQLERLLLFRGKGGW
jgi:hypothetical protein